MKNLAYIILAGIGFISLSAAAQQTEPMKKDSTEQVVASTETMTTPEEFKKIDKSQLPQAVKDAVMNDFDGMMVTEAYITPDETFKIVVSGMNDKSKTQTLWADKEGKWLKPKQ